MTITDSAIWAYDVQRSAIIWGNQAAAGCWGVNKPDQLAEVDGREVHLLEDYLSADQPFELDFGSNKSRRFQTDKLSESIYLFSEVQSCPELKLSLDRTASSSDNNSMLSTFDQSGQLISRSHYATLRLPVADTLFIDRFVDKEQGMGLWRTMAEKDYAEGHFLTHTTDGPRWHIIQLNKSVAVNESWLVQLRELDIDQFIQNEHSLRNTLKEQEVIFEHAGTGICFIKDSQDHERKIIRCNRKFADIYDYRVEELIGQSSSILYPDFEAFSELGDSAYPSLMEGTLYTQKMKMKRKDGTLFWTQIRGNIISSNEPGLGYIWIVEDIDQQVKADEALKVILNEQNLILDYAMVGIVFLKNRSVTRCNQRFEEMFGYNAGELAGSSSRQWYLTEQDWKAAGNACYKPLSQGKVFQDEMLLSRKDGSPIWCEVTSKAIDPDDLAKGSIWITMDITERKAADVALARAHEDLELRVKERTKELAKANMDLLVEINERKMAEERVKHMALHDALTGLPNRLLLEERLENALSEAKSRQWQLAVLFIDLDRFKLVNDTLGHHEGDQLLVEVANRLHQVIGANDTVARLGGDEFVIVLNEIAGSAEINGVIEDIQQNFKPAVKLALQDMFVTPSIGVAIYPEDGETPVQLMKNADAAMYHAKASGRNCAQYFNRSLDDSLKERISLENALNQALKLGQFELYYQPQLDVKSNRIIGAEALIRWNHPEKGMISPDAFIPLAEETGLIVDIGSWVLHQASAQLAQWRKQGFEQLSVSVNLSALQVQKESFAKEVADVIREYGVPEACLDLELTESMIMRNAEETIAALDEIHNLGIQISVDDFGTGYSSLSYLKRFPLDKLKIDRSFVQDITVDTDDAMICKTIISMAHNLNLQVIAEGVETHAQLELLRDYGCEQYQGYLFAKPLPVEQMTEHLLASPCQ